MKKNTVLSVKIEAMSADGAGIARVNGEVIFVPATAVDDEAEIVIIKEYKNYSVGKLINIVSPSSVRVTPDCKVFPRCGGCVFRHVTLSEEERIKKENVEAVMQRIGKINVKVEDVLTPLTKHYRNKTQIPVSQNKDALQCGFYAPHSHRMIEESTDCVICHEAFSHITKSIMNFLSSNNVEGYNEEAKSGVVRHLYYRVNKENKVSVTVVTNTKYLVSIDFEKSFAEYIKDAFPHIANVYINYNSKDTNVVLSDDFRIIYGEDHFEDELLDCRFKLSPDSFFQVNRVGAEEVYKKAFSLLEGKHFENVYDLYCGVGTIGITLFSMMEKGQIKATADRLFGIEIVENAAECATLNASKNGISNARFMAADSLDITKSDWFDKYPPSLVILDPPRKGTTTELLDFLSDKGVSDILYISCDPATLARDTGYLYGKGYTSTAVYPVNLFPGTKHCECCVLLCRT